MRRLPEVLVLADPPRRVPPGGEPQPLPTRVCARPAREGLAWEALEAEAPEPDPDEALTLDLARDLADLVHLARPAELEAALDAWWSPLEPRLAAGAPVLVVLPFASMPRAAAAFRAWAARRLRRPLLLVAEALLPVLGGLDRMRGLLEARAEGAPSMDFGLPCGVRRLRVQGSRDRFLRLDLLQWERVGADPADPLHELPAVDLAEAARRLVESLERGPDTRVRLRVRPTWTVVPRGSRRPVFSAHPPRRARVWQTSLHLRRLAAPPRDLDLVCSLGPGASDRSRVATLEAPAAELLRLDLWLGPRGGRARLVAPGSRPSGFLDFPLPGLLA